MFDNDSTEIFGRGNVVVRHAENVIFADLIYINPDTGDVSGEGNVMAVFSNSRVYTEKIFYNTKTQEAYCKNADVISPPWIIRCEKMVKEGDTTRLTKPVFTTCDSVNPHYRMEAAEINMYGAKKIEAWHVGVYLGLIPVFYFPYFSQSLEGNKDPFEFQIKWNDDNGWYTNIKYYFFTRVLDTFTAEGQAGFDYYEKKGPQLNVNLQYAFSPESTGSFTGFYLKEKFTEKQRWGLNFAHNQAFGQNMRAGLTANTASDSNLVSNFISTEGLYDIFKHELAGSFTGTFFNSHTIGLTVNDTEQLEPFVNTYTARNYYTYSRLLPGVTYNMTSAQLLPNVYYNHSASFNRSYHYSTVTASGLYSDVGAFNPGLQVNTPKLGFATLSANATVNSAWTKSRESDPGWGELLNSLNTSETLQLEIVPAGRLSGSVVHSYAKQLNKTEAMPFDGIKSNLISAKLNGGIGTFTYDSSLSYDMLKENVLNELDKLSFLAVNGSFRHDVYYMTANSNFSLYSGQVRNTAFNFSIIDNSPKSLWSASAKADFVNNRIDGAGHPVTYTPQEDALNFSTAFSFGFTPDLRASVYRNYDLAKKTLVSHSYALTWYIHCWQADLSWSKRSDGKEDIFFSIAISAIPEFRVNKPSSAMPDQFKNLENLIPQ